MGSGGGQPGLVDLTTMTLEDQGTVLFNRVMSSNSTGDTADVAFFLPKAFVIYEQLNPTDPDGLYHYALLHQVDGDFENALAKARTGLADTPDYLLLLAVAAEASAALGDNQAAREYYGRFLEVYDEEMALMRPGYEHHQSIFPVYRDEATAFLEGG
jgi:tetratricopeptide (TPR) repeat protein